jgi:MFS family permease
VDARPLDSPELPAGGVSAKSLAGSLAGRGPSGARPFSFRRLVLAVIFLNASGGVLFAVLPLLELQEGGGPLLATLIVGAPLLAQVLATFLWGALSDRLGRRRELLTGGVLAQSVLFLAYPFLAPVPLLAVRIVQVFLGAASSLATTVATEDPRRPAGHGLGDLSFWGGIGGVLGVLAGYPFLGGAMFTAHSTAAFALFGLLALLSGAAVVGFALSGELGRDRAPARPLREAFRFESGPWVLRLSLAAGLVGNYTVYTIFPLFVRNLLAPQGPVFYALATNPTQQLALLSIGAGLGGVLASPATGRWVEVEAWRRRLFLGAPVLYALLWAGFAAFRGSFLAVFLIWSVPAAVFFQIPLTREVAALTPPAERGRAVGLLVAAYTFGGLLGSFVAGLGVEAGLAYPTMFLLSAVIDLGGFVALLAVLAGGGFPAPGSRPPGRDSVGPPFPVS